MPDIFEDNYLQYDKWYEKNHYAYLSEIEAVKKVLPPAGYGLEIGVGTGRFAAPLGIDIGIDASENMVNLARKRGVNAILGSGPQLSFNDSTFDHVLIIFTLCFVSSPQETLLEAKRVLKQGGKLIIGFVDKDSFLGKHYQGTNSLFYEKARFFSFAQIEHMLTSKGFTELNVYQTISSLPENITSVERPEPGHGAGGFIVVSSIKGRPA